MASLSPSAIFSPTIARQQQAAAKDWAYVDAWLASKFGGSVPDFERNLDTLRTLLALAAVNDTADEECELYSLVEEKQLTQLDAVSRSSSDSRLLDSLQTNLTQDGSFAIEALANATVTMNQPCFDVEDFACKVLDLNAIACDAEQARERVEVRHAHLAANLCKNARYLDSLRSQAYQPIGHLAKQTLDYQRKSKILAGKYPDSSDRALAANTAGASPRLNLRDIVAEEDKYKAHISLVKTLEAEVCAFHGLPHDTNLARLELEALRNELEDLKMQREEMFEGLVERDSPEKLKSRR